MKFVDWLKNNWERAVDAIFVGTVTYGLLCLAVAAILVVFEGLCKAGAWGWLGFDVVILCAFIYYAYNHTIRVDIKLDEKN